MLMRHTAICGLPRCTTFSTLSHTRHGFRGGGGNLLNTNCVFWFCLQFLSDEFLIIIIIQRDIIINACTSSCKIPVILVGFKWKLNFLDRFSKNTQIPNFMKIRPVGAEFSYADRQMDIHGRTMVFFFAVLLTNLKTVNVNNPQADIWPLDLPITKAFLPISTYFPLIRTHWPNSC